MKQTSFGSNTLFSKFKCPPKSPQKLFVGWFSKTQSSRNASTDEIRKYDFNTVSVFSPKKNYTRLYSQKNEIRLVSPPSQF